MQTHWLHLRLPMSAVVFLSALDGWLIEISLVGLVAVYIWYLQSPGYRRRENDDD
jgi:hypothetical protein